MGQFSKSTNFRIGRIVLVAVAVLVMMSCTHPGKVPALLLVVPFMAMFLLGYFLCMEVLQLFAADDQVAGMRTWIRRPRLLSALFAGYPVLLLVLQSIMELNRWDLIIATAIFVLAYLVISRGAFAAKY